MRYFEVTAYFDTRIIVTDGHHINYLVVTYYSLNATAKGGRTWMPNGANHDLGRADGAIDGVAAMECVPGDSVICVSALLVRPAR